jgi:hypothetical protein
MICHGLTKIDENGGGCCTVIHPLYLPDRRITTLYFEAVFMELSCHD